MKKIVLIISVLVIMLLLAGCWCKHEWKDATCTEPKTCALCGETEGEPLGHTAGEWLDADSVIGGTSIRKCVVCGETIEEKEYDRSTKEDIILFDSGELTMTMDEFVHHLICYLPDDVVIDIENRFDDYAWIPGSTFSIVSSDLNRETRYIRVWYAENYANVTEDHIDAYFDKASDFTDIAEEFFAAIDQEYANSESFSGDLQTIINGLERKDETVNNVKMTDGYFLFSYVAPYEIFGTWYPGFYEIRVLSDQFYNEHYENNN